MEILSRTNFKNYKVVKSKKKRLKRKRVGEYARGRNYKRKRDNKDLKKGHKNKRDNAN